MRAAGPRAPAVGHVSARYVVFLVEGQAHALPLSAVREVVVTPDVFTRVPRAPGAVRGVVNLRGRVVTVVDLRPLLHLAEAALPPSKLLLLDRGRRDLALGVQEVVGIEELDVSGAEATGLVQGVARLGGHTVRLLDAEELEARVAGLFLGR